MASEAKDLFGCPYCGFRVSPTDDACPRCGNGFGASTKFECPFCGDMVAPGIPECPSCHVNFKDFIERSQRKVNYDSVDSLLMDIIKLESSSVKKEEKKFSCPKCSWMLDGSEDKCPKCGTDLTADAALQCPICGTFVSNDTATCPECGASFAEDLGIKGVEQRVDDHEAVSSALTDILASAGHIGPLPEIESPKEEPEPEAPEPVVPEPVPEPVKIVEEVPEPEIAAEPDLPPAQEPKMPSTPPGPKKTKQRKLKAKTPGPKK